MSSPSGEGVSPAERLLGSFTGPEFADAPAVEPEELFCTTEQFCDDNQSIIVRPKMLVGTLAWHFVEASLGRPNDVSVKRSGSKRLPRISLALDASQRDDGHFTWELHNNHDFFVAELHQTRLVQAAHYVRDLQDRMRSDRVIEQPSEKAMILKFIASFLDNDHLRSEITNLRSTKEELRHTALSKTGKVAMTEKQRKKVSEAADEHGLVAVPWKLRSGRLGV